MFKQELKITFFKKFSTLNRGGQNVGEKRWGRQSYLANLIEDMKEAHTILAYTPQSTSNVLMQSGLLSFLSILAYFPRPKL